MYEKAIYDIIDENIENGELPEDFSIAAALGEDTSYAAGAYDGITLYHVGRSTLSEESLINACSTKQLSIHFSGSQSIILPWVR